MILGKAGAEEKILTSVITGEPLEVAPVAEAEAPSGVPSEEGKTQETKKEEPKEESAAGLASLFG